MRQKLLKPFLNIHWSAKAIIKFGVMAADILLISACLCADKTRSYMMAETSGYLFSEAVIGGLILDVIAKRMDIEEK
ncbi:MAG: hypothetical protein IKW59_00400 [Clostridia bacterium]|nr:hypothetical protein [Clostridia bacterium]